MFRGNPPFKRLRAAAMTAALSLAFVGAEAASVNLLPSADGDVQTWGGNSLRTGGASLDVTQSGGLARNAVLEFDLSGIADSSTITAARLDITLSRFISQTGGNPAAVDLFAYAGDGVVTLGDYDAFGTQVVDTTTPSIGTASGDVLSFEFSDAAVVQDALVGNLLTLRMETDSFAGIRFAALEHATLDAANLHLEVAPVPVPGALVLMLSALGVAGCRARAGARISRVLSKRRA